MPPILSSPVFGSNSEFLLKNSSSFVMSFVKYSCSVNRCTFPAIAAKDTQSWYLLAHLISSPSDIVSNTSSEQPSLIKYCFVNHH